MNSFTNNKTKTVKKLCSVGVDIKTNYGKVLLNLKVGEDKLYIIKSKANAFFNSYYNNQGKVKFGKNFEYDSSNCYFTEEDRALIDFAYDVYHYGYSNSEFVLNDFKFKQLLKLASNKDISINGDKIIGIQEFNNDVILDKKDGNYVLSIDFDMDKVTEYARMRNPKIEIFPICARTGEGVDAWCDWLRRQVNEWQA